MKRGLCGILCAALLLTLNGCWSRREPKTLAIISSALYELNEDGTYKTTIEILNPEAEGGPQGGGGDKSPTLTITGEGKSLPEALRMSSTSLERNLFAGQTLVRFYSENLAKKDLLQEQDYLIRDFLTDEKPLMVVVKSENPELLFTSDLGLSDTVGTYIDNLHMTQDNFISTAVFIDTLLFLQDYYLEGKQPVAGVAEIVEDNEISSENADAGGDEKSTPKSNEKNNSESGSKKLKIKYEGLAAFKDKKLVGYFDGIEARAYKILENTIGNSVVTLPGEDDIVVLRVDSSKTSLTVDTDNDENIKLDADIKMDISIIHAGTAIDVYSFEILKDVENRFNKQIVDEVYDAIKKAQTEFKSDIFGFGTAMHRRSPKKWKKYKDNWDEHFTKADVEINVESSIKRSGLVKGSIGKKSK